MFLNVLLSGSKQTVRNLEDMVKRKQNMYNLEEWEEFERVCGVSLLQVLKYVFVQPFSTDGFCLW